MQMDQIIAGCRQNKRQHQNALYKAYYSYGMSITIRYAQDEQEALSILNDGFLKVFTHIKKYDSTKDFKPWFRRIVVNTALNHMKKNKTIFLQTELNEAVHVTSREEILSRIGYQELMNIVRTLSTAYRTVFNLYVIDGYKHEEISQSLGISVGTSKSNLSKARAILQTKISKYLDNGLG